MIPRFRDPGLGETAGAASLLSHAKPTNLEPGPRCFDFLFGLGARLIIDSKQRDTRSIYIYMYIYIYVYTLNPKP